MLSLAQQLNASAIYLEGQRRKLSLDAIRSALARAYERNEFKGSSRQFVLDLFDHPMFTQMHAETLPVIDGFLIDAAIGPAVSCGVIEAEALC